MELIDLENKKPTIHPAALLIKEFKVIWDRDKHKDKQVAIEELAFLFFYCHHKSPYRYYSEEERFDKIKGDIITIKDWTPDAVVEKARDKYRELINTPSMGLLNDAETAAGKIRNYFQSVSLKDDKDGRKVSTLVQTLSKVTDIVKSLYSLRELVEKEIYEARTARGGRTMSKRELPPGKRDI